ncbi:hypothetical protein Mapa_014898 [Marchantia paleacea]|nr:hypothetical protein Mapa_014898 [Marchantia paleacea]
MAATEPDYFFLGEPSWEPLPGGRVRCSQTGHEMPAAAQATYSLTKKCRAALFDAALKKRIAPLNFFEQSPDNKDKIVCKLTGVVLNKKEDAVWKHMMGKKFEQKLAEKEAEKERALGDVEMMENSDREQSEKKSAEGKGKAFDDAEMMENSTKKQSSKKAGKNEGSKSGKSKYKQQSELGSKSVYDEEREDGEEAESSESSEFWMPPPGDRWDFDDGSEDRWSQPGDPEGIAKPAEDEADDDTEMADGPGEDGDDNSSSEDEVKIRTKRTASGLSKQAKRRRAKRSRKEASK